MVFSPFAAPTYIPLGIAQLKAYIQSRIPSVTVHNIDLNIRFFRNLGRRDFIGHCKESCLVCPQSRRCRARKNIDQAWWNYRLGIDCLTNRQGKEFGDPLKYNFLIAKVFPFFDHWRGCLSRFAQGVLKEKAPFPPSLERLLAEDIDLIQSQKPDLIGFSLLAENQLAYSLLLAKLMRGATQAPFVFGGAFMNYLDPPSLLKLFDFVDFVIDQEGEAGLESLIQSLGKGDPRKTPGIFFRANPGIKKNPSRFLESLDLLPRPDFSDFDLSRYLMPRPVLPVKFSRGCYWRKCTFCNYHRAYLQPSKEKSLGKIIDEINFFTAQNIRHFFILDDAVSAQRLVAFSKALMKNRLQVFFGAVVRPEKEFTSEALRTIYEAGGRAFMWGVETSSQRILNLMKKGTRIQDIRRILKFAHRLGFFNHLFMIWGFPTQTKAEMKADVKFLLQNREFIDDFGMHDFGVAKESYIFHHPEKFRVRNLRDTILLRGPQRKPVIYRAFVSFQPEATPRWSQGEMNPSFWSRKNGGVKFRIYEQAHMLLHASG